MNDGSTLARPGAREEWRRHWRVALVALLGSGLSF